MCFNFFQKKMQLGNGEWEWEWEWGTGMGIKGNSLMKRDASILTRLHIINCTLLTINY